MLGEETTIIDPAPLPPVTLDLILDDGGGSEGSTASLAVSLRAVVPTLPPGSVVRLHDLGNSVATSREFARFTISAPHKRTKRALEEQQRNDTVLILKELLAAAKPTLVPRARHASPIAQAIVRAVLAENDSGGIHHILYAGDARQFSKGDALGAIDMECGHLPSVGEFTVRLAHIVKRDDLRGVTIHFVGVALTPIDHDRCQATVERYRAIEDLWVQSFSRLGAQVTWSMEPLHRLN